MKKRGRPKGKIYVKKFTLGLTQEQYQKIKDLAKGSQKSIQQTLRDTIAFFFNHIKLEQ
ncbi:MAG: hypothetical protein NC918_02650 [Candidatus Omnitrophica bacterium]|nr:hypothetical protein [Candidatus Omnitrophota bacterium]